MHSHQISSEINYLSSYGKIYNEITKLREAKKLVRKNNGSRLENEMKE